LLVVLSVIVIVCCVDFSHVRLSLAKRLYHNVRAFADDVMHVFSTARSKNMAYSHVTQLEQWFIGQMNRIVT